MGRWTVTIGEQKMIIEAIDSNTVRVEITPGGTPLIANRRTVEEIRLKLGAAIGNDDITDPAT